MPRHEAELTHGQTQDLQLEADRQRRAQTQDQHHNPEQLRVLPSREQLRDLHEAIQ